MKCELKLMGKHAKEAVNDLWTMRGIENLFVCLLATATISAPTTILIGITAGIIVIIICIVVAFALSYYFAGIECRKDEVI